jgi:hypothetical protein
MEPELEPEPEYDPPGVVRNAAGGIVAWFPDNPGKPTLEETLEALRYMEAEGLLSPAFRHLLVLLQEARDAG